MAVGVVHVGVATDVDAAGAIDAARLDQRVLGLAAIGAAVHAQRAADRAGNAAQKRQPGDAGLLRRARHLHVRHRGAGARCACPPTVTSLKPRPSRTTTPGTPPSRTIRLEPRPITVTGMSRADARKKIREVRLVLRHEQHLRRPADAKPGRQRRPAARFAAAAGRAV